MFDRTVQDEPIVKPVLALRAMVGAVTLLLALALFVLKASPAHDFCVGGAFGMMIGVCVVSLEIKSVGWNDREPPSDVEGYKLT